MTALAAIPAWQIGAVLSVLSILGALVLVPAVQREARVRARLHAVSAAVAGAPLETAAQALATWARPFAALGTLIVNSGLLPRKTVEALTATVAASGARPGPALSLFVGAKVALVVGLPFAALLFVNLLGIAPRTPILVIAPAAMVGLLLPDMIVRSIRGRYLASVEAGLPGALDLMIVCAEAGLTMEVGFDRVAAEFRSSNRACAQEMQTTANEMKVLPDRRQALLNMGLRTGLPAMQSLGGTLAQSLKYGTSLTQALRTLALEVRQTVLTRYEARAARLPVLLTIPMILFILPCTFVIVAGPAAIQILKLMRGH